MTAPVTEVAPVWQNYIDVANDAKRWLQIPSNDTTRDLDLQDLVDAACWYVQDLISNPIAPTQFFRRLNGYEGWGGNTIELPYYPILGVPTVVEYWGSSGPHTLAIQTPENQGGSDMFTLDSLHGYIIRSYLGLLPRPTFPGLRNIEVTWTAGRQPIPPPVKMATREYVKFWWTHSQSAPLGATLGGRSPAHFGAEDQEWPGVEAKIKGMLHQYLQVGIG